MAGFFAWGVLICTFFCMPEGALAAAAHSSIPGAQLSVLWAIPFVCMLLSIAVMPLALPHLWERHFGKIAALWGMAFLVPCLVVYGFSVAWYEFLHIILLDYIPFLVLLFTLFTVAGGVRLKGSLVGTPVVNTGLLAVGTVLASCMGTTGAAMLLIRPLLRANAHRRYRAHSVVFFIFLVANIGGSLTPLGDPPLFLGFLKGVDFFWTTIHLLAKTCLLAAILLAIFFVLDSVLYNKEGCPQPAANTAAPTEKLGIEGGVNLLFLLGVVVAVLASGICQMGELVSVFGVSVEAQNLLRDVLLLCLAGLSLRFTSRRCRELNGFSWAPIEEVAKLFFGIFVSILSSFLDNAPTYLVFFNTAGGDAQHLMHDMPATLAAISAGAVFMGANSYIGNAPNFMVRSIAESDGVRMPSFFGYMLWSVGILVPLFALLTWLFFM